MGPQNNRILSRPKLYGPVCLRPSVYERTIRANYCKENFRRVFMRLKMGIAVMALVGLAGFAQADQTRTDAVERLQSATKVLHQIVNTPDKGIPDEVFKGAKCVAVVPGLIKGGFIIAGKHGRGVATCRTAKGGWSAPAFFTISGGSWGAQIGVESVDLVMMIMNNEGMRHLMGDKFQIGGEAAALGRTSGTPCGSRNRLESRVSNVDVLAFQGIVRGDRSWRFGGRARQGFNPGLL